MQPPFCRDSSAAADAPRLQLTERKLRFKPCEKEFPGKPVEDLGTEEILGLRAHGCRARVEVDGLAYVDEAWQAEVGTTDLLTVRRLTRHPNQEELEEELIRIDLNEPDEAVFQPPTGYEIRSIEMHEVSCGSRPE